MGTFSPYHWLVVALVVILVFGPKRLATAGKGLGEGLRELRAALRNEPPES
jgi:sec-independent protein translocase protein TatA